MDNKPALAELMYDLAEAHRVKAIAADSEFDRGACDAFERAAGIIEEAETVATDDDLLKHAGALGSAASDGGESDE